jgi:hypothetical protein
MIEIWSNWIKGFARNLRDGGTRSAFGFLVERKIFNLIHNIPKSWPIASNEIQVLVGHDRIPMMLWMAASLMVSTRTRWPFVIHDDGSFRPADERILRACLPHSRIILCSDSDEHLQAELRSFPLLAKYRSNHAFGKRLTDFPFFCKSQTVLSIDTDVLFFRNPLLFMSLAFNQSDASLFLTDVEDTSLIDPDDFARKTGMKLARLVNAGLFSIPKAFMEYDVMERIIKDFALLDDGSKTWFVEQTVLGAIASLKGRVELLPLEYEQTLSGGMRNESIMRHYVGKVRHFFYSEGLPIVSGYLRKKPYTTELV